MGPGDLCRHFGELGRSEHKGEESSRRVAVYIVRYIDFELPFIYPSPYHPINMGDRTSLKFIVTLGKWRMNLEPNKRTVDLRERHESDMNSERQACSFST